MITLADKTVYVVTYLRAGCLWNLAAFRQRKAAKKLCKEWKSETSGEADVIFDKLTIP